MDLVLSMDNLIEYSSNYSKATGNLWFYSEDEETNFNADVANNNNFRSFKFIFSQPVPNVANGILKNATIDV